MQIGDIYMKVYGISSSPAATVTLQLEAFLEENPSVIMNATFDIPRDSLHLPASLCILQVVYISALLYSNVI
jgi:hypothetical protein